MGESLHFLYFVVHNIFLYSLCVIGRLCFMFVALSGHLIYHFSVLFQWFRCMCHPGFKPRMSRSLVIACSSDSYHYRSYIMRNPVHAMCEQQRLRSTCASAQSDQRLCCSLPKEYNTSNFYIRNFKPLPSVCSWAGRFESTLVANPEDRVSRDEAQLFRVSLIKLFSTKKNILWSKTGDANTFSIKTKGYLPYYFSLFLSLKSK